VICGAKIAAPDRPAIAYVGDGAWGISLNELLTCAREKIGVTVVLFNNGQWARRRRTMSTSIRSVIWASSSTTRAGQASQRLSAATASR